MHPAPLPADETGRLAALCRLEILDTPPEEAFERITNLAARLFAVPIAVISLVDQDRQWFKSCYGLDVTQTDRKIAFCAHAILYPSPLVIPDARLDERFADNPLVTGEPRIRFYAGAVLRSREGYNLGTLCLIDRRPRAFDEKQQASLNDLAALVMRELELRLDAVTINRTHVALKELIEKVSAVTGRAFFRTLVHHLGESLGVEHVLVGKLSHDREDQFTAIAVYRHKALVDSFELPLAVPLDCDSSDLQSRFSEQLGTGQLAGYASVTLRDGDGRPLGLLAVLDHSTLSNTTLVQTLLDISAIRASAELERLRSVEALHKSQQMLQLVMDNIPQAVFWKDRHSVYLGCNRNFSIAAGFEQAETIVGKTDYDLPWQASEADDYQALDRQVMAEDRLYHVIESQQRAPGKQAWLSTNKVPLHDDRGQVIGVLGTYEDITEHKRAEEALRSAEAKYRSIFENAVEGIFQTSLEGRILSANPALARICGYESPTQLMAQLTDIERNLYVEPNRRTQFVEWMAEHEVLVKFESEIRRPDRSIIWISEDVRAIRDSQGALLYYEGIIEEITERKWTEAETQRALSRERELNELKSRFITTASHEFRTPLSTILAAAELLENYEDKLSADKKQRYFKRISGAVSEMVKLLDDVLIIGAEEVGKLGFKPTDLDPTEFCVELIEEMRLSMGLEHTLNFSHDGKCNQACMDERLLRYILGNLLSNAIKYSPKASTVQLYLHKHEERAIFQVCDEGIGISAEDQQRLFESFHRGRNVGNIPGTGLGLTIVLRSVALHGGSVIFASETGSGTTFTVALPLFSAQG